MIFINNIKRNRAQNLKKVLKISSLLLAIILPLSSTFASFTTMDSITNNIKTIDYQLKINPNGGKYNENNVIIDNNNVVLPTPIKSGYDFLGYSTSLNGEIKYSSSINNVESINNQLLYANWGVESYTIQYNLNGGTLSNPKTSYNIEETFTLPIPTRTGYDFAGWTGTGVSTPTTNLTITNSTGNKTFTANWKAKKYSVDINSIIQNVSYASGLNGFTFTVWIDGVLVANRVTDYYNNSVNYGSKVRVYVYDRDGYSVTSFRDQTWTVNGNLVINPSWYDNIAPTITSFTVENLGYYNPDKGPAAGWNIRVTINAYDNGTGIQKYQMWIEPYKNGSGSTIHETQSRVFTNVLYLQESTGRTFCATAIDNAGNKSQKCDTIRI